MERQINVSVMGKKNAAVIGQNLWVTFSCLCMFVVKLAQNSTSKDFVVLGGGLAGEEK